MIKQLIKSLLGEKNTKKIRRLKTSLKAAKVAWQNFGHTHQTDRDKLIYSCLMSVHMLEKALAIENEKYLDSVKYDSLISDIARLVETGTPPGDFTVAGSVAIIKSALDTLHGHEEDKSQLESLIRKHNIPANFKGGIETIQASEIFSHVNFDFHGFVSSRHSVRKFKDKIIPREKIYDIVRDALFCPSACNRQPFKVYFSENEKTIAQIIKAVPDQFVVKGIHDCLIVTCDKSLLNPSELGDQEYINAGIFLGYLVMSIHAHGLGSCLFQFLQVDRRQERIKRAFEIKDNEIIAGFVGIGELEDEVKIACAQRRPVETVAINLDS